MGEVAHPAGPATASTHEEDLMQTIHLAWDLPTNRTDGSGLPAAEIAQVTVVDHYTGAINNLAPTSTTFDTGDVTGQAGSHSFSVTVIDTQTPPVASSVMSVSVTVPASPPLAAPNPVSNLTGTLL